MTSTEPKPDTGPVLFDENYREFIWKLLQDLESERIKVFDLQREVKAYSARVRELERRIR